MELTRTQKLEEANKERELRTGVREFASHQEAVQEAKELLGLQKEAKRGNAQAYAFEVN